MGDAYQLFSNVPNVYEMTHYACETLLQGYGFKAKEIGPYRDNIRFDVLGIKRSDRTIRIFEIKSCRSDFTSDKKWQRYLPYCTHFAFIAPKDTIRPEELPEGIGLVEIWCEEKESRQGGHYTVMQHKYEKRCKRLREKPKDKQYIDLLEAVTMRLLHTNSASNYMEVLNKLNNINYRLAQIEKRPTY